MVCIGRGQTRMGELLNLLQERGGVLVQENRADRAVGPWGLLIVKEDVSPTGEISAYMCAASNFVWQSTKRE